MSDELIVLEGVMTASEAAVQDGGGDYSPGTDRALIVQGFHIYNAPLIEDPVYTGDDDLDDMSTGGESRHNTTTSYRVEIDGTGTPDTFKWSNDGGSTWVASTVAITGTAQTLEKGVTVTFGATTGHTAEDHWDFDVSCVARYGRLKVEGTILAGNEVIPAANTLYVGGMEIPLLEGEKLYVEGEVAAVMAYRIWGVEVDA